MHLFVASDFEKLRLNVFNCEVEAQKMKIVGENFDQICREMNCTIEREPAVGLLLKT